MASQLLKAAEIVELESKWRDYYRDIDRQGDEITLFMTGKQWSDEAIAARQAANRELLTADLIGRHWYRLLADYMNVDYTLTAQPIKPKTDIQLNAAIEFWETVVLSDHHETVYHEGFKAFSLRGYTVFGVRPDYRSQNQYQLVPKITHEDGTNVFFDPRARSQFKDDGRYCGIVQYFDHEYLRQKYPRYKQKYPYARIQGTMFSSEQMVRVCDFFFKKQQNVKYYRVDDIFISEKNITPMQKASAREYFEKLEEHVYTCRATEDVMLTLPQRYYTDYLPFVFVGEPLHTSLLYSKQAVEKIMMYFSPLIPIQSLLNNVLSQIGSQTTKLIERSVILDKLSVDKNDMAAWDAMNTQAGPLPYSSGDVEGTVQYREPRIVDPPTLDPNLIGLVPQLKFFLDEVAGINLAQQGAANDNSRSGIMQSQRIEQGNLVQRHLLNVFVDALNRVGILAKAMMAAVVKDPMEWQIGGKSVVLNEKLATQLPDEAPLNSLEEFDKSYNFMIKASPSLKDEKKRARETLASICTASPNMQPYLMDKLVENLDIMDAPEIATRIRVLTDKVIIAAGKGEITEDEARDILSQRQAQQQQPDPNMALVQMEAENNKERNELKAVELELRKKEAQQKLAVEQSKVMIKASEQNRKDAIKVLEIQQKEFNK